MSDARRAAEEALARWDTYADRPHSDARHEALYACVRSLRALLAEREATPGPSCSTCDGYGSTTVPVHDRNGYPIPEQRKCDDCDGTGHVPLAPPPAPCGGRCEDALDSRSPCQSCAERLAPPPAPMAERDEWRGNAAMQAVMAGDRARERDTAESRLSRATEALRAARDTLAAVNYTPVYVVIERIDSALSEIGEPVRSVRERLGRDKTVPGHPGDPELLR